MIAGKYKIFRHPQECLFVHLTANCEAWIFFLSRFGLVLLKTQVLQLVTKPESD